MSPPRRSAAHLRASSTRPPVAIVGMPWLVKREERNAELRIASRWPCNPIDDNDGQIITLGLPGPGIDGAQQMIGCRIQLQRGIARERCLESVESEEVAVGVGGFEHAVCVQKESVAIL